MSDNDSISQAIIKLFEDQRFYAELICQMNRTTTTEKDFTAGVCIKDKIELRINPEEFEKHTIVSRVGILKHECEHILRDHIARAQEISPGIYDKTDDVEEQIIKRMKHRNINIAMDLAINTHLTGQIEGGCFPKNLDLPDNQTSEWYMENLKDNEKMKQLTHFDGHSIWGESDGDKEILKEKVKQAINEAAKRTRAAGKMTAENELTVSSINNKPKDWKSDLRRFVAKSMEYFIETSKKKRNRRYGIQYPGIIKLEKLHIGVVIDTSGSMIEEALNQAIAEIGNIAKYAEVTVVEADAEVKNSYKFKLGKKYTIKGRGGTAYQPALDFFTKNYDIDGLIYIGDMDCYDNEQIKKPAYPVIWAVIGKQNPPVKWGNRTRIEINTRLQR